LNTPRIVEDRIGIGMIENRKGLESMGVRAWEWAGKVLGKFLEISCESSWKVLGKFLESSGVRVWVVVS
jgi:hypothetical protein